MNNAPFRAVLMHGDAANPETVRTTVPLPASVRHQVNELADADKRNIGDTAALLIDEALKARANPSACTGCIHMRRRASLWRTLRRHAAAALQHAADWLSPKGLQSW